MAVVKIDLGQVGFWPRGQWKQTGQYKRLDVVQHNGSGFVAITDSTGVEPVDGATWMLVARKGDASASPNSDGSVKISTSTGSWDVITSEMFVIDDTLSKPGAPADAAATGEIKQDLDSTDKTLSVLYSKRFIEYSWTRGAIPSPSDFSRIKTYPKKIRNPVELSVNQQYRVTCRVYNGASVIFDSGWSTSAKIDAEYVGYDSIISIKAADDRLIDVNAVNQSDFFAVEQIEGNAIVDTLVNTVDRHDASIKFASQTISSIVEPTYSLADTTTVDWFGRNSAAVDVSVDGIRVTATVADPNSYAYCHVPIPDGCDKVTISVENFTSNHNRGERVRVGGATTGTGTAWTWLGGLPTGGNYRTFSVSGYTHLVIALYASLLDTEVGDYTIYDRVMAANSAEKLPYIKSPYTAVDLISRSKVVETAEIVSILQRRGRGSFATVKCIGHRGYLSGVPENTIPALVECQKAGFEYAENDVLWTADDVPVISHNTTLSAWGYGDVVIADHTLSQLKQYDLGVQWGISGVHILTLEEWFIACKRLGLKALCHNKENTLTPEHAEIVIRCARNTGMLRHTIWLMGNAVRLRAYDPKACVRSLGDPTPENVEANKKYILDDVEDSFGFSPQYSSTELTPENIRNAIENGFCVGCWADTPVDSISDRLAELSDLGLSEFTTNDIPVSDILISSLTKN